MKKKLIAIALSSILCHLSSAFAAEYTLTGTRYLRKYTAPQESQVYMAEIDAQRIADKMCDVPWELSYVTRATATTHVTTNLNLNVSIRESFDAALFCANHVADQHLAYANAACYRFDFEDAGQSLASLPAVTNLKLTVYSDPYNAYGARISIIASDSTEIPTDCATVRGDVSGGIFASNVAQRVTRTNATSTTWYPASTNLVFSVGGVPALPSGGLQLKKHLFVFVLMENYATSRGNWLEGCSWIEPQITIHTSAPLPGQASEIDIQEPYASKYHLADGHAAEDWDGDGLSNYAEYLISEVFKFANLDPDNAKTDMSCVDFYRRPEGGELYFGELFMGYRTAAAANDVRSLRLRASYLGKRRVEAPLVLEAWSTARDPLMSGEPDAVYRRASAVVNGEHALELVRDDTAGMGFATAGTYNAVAYADEDGDGAFTPGEPFAFLRGIELGANDLAAELSDDSPVFARFDLLSGAYAARPGSVSVAVSNDTAGVTENDRHTRIRVIRVLVNGVDEIGITKTIGDAHIKDVVLDKYLDLGTRSYIHEGDFLTDGAFDCDWATMQNQVVNKQVVLTSRSCILEQNTCDATNVTYAIVIGEGEIGASNLVFRCVVNKTFDPYFTRTNAWPSVVKPVIDATQPQDLVYGSRPTFRFAMRDPEGNNYNSYTAFKLKITTDGGTEVYDSGFRSMPPCDENGWYSWTLDEPIGAKIPASGNYKWRVALYNAKYQSGTYQGNTITEWSDAGTFVVNMNNQQAMNDHGYSSVAVAVKYAGPSAVLKKGKCIVQAFETADFAGVPAGQSYVTDDLTNTASVVANAAIKGLPQTGTYWLRAFIDMNTNGVCDAFESCGAAKASVSLTPETVAMPTVGIWIEDADTDGDWVPDAYEYARYGNLTSLTGEIIGGDNIVFSGAAGSTGTAGISTCLGGASLTIFQNATLAGSGKPLGTAVSTRVSLYAIRAAVEAAANHDTVKITALTLSPDGTKVTLSVAAEVTDSIAGELLGEYYDIASGSTATVTVKVWKKATLATADWTLVCTQTASVGRGDVEVDVPVTGVDMTNGYYKVEVVQ